MQSIEFPPFRLDREDGRLWRGKQAVALRPKTWNVLVYLAERPGRMVPREELLDAVWPDVAVSPGALNQSIRELREALGDDARKPRFIETVHRRGFRFIAGEPPAQPLPEPQKGRGSRAIRVGVGRPLPGRDADLARLRERFEEARSGSCQIVFLTGEPGIGKSRLLRTFLEQLADDDAGEPVWIAGGQCVEHHGEAEAYLPVLEALDRLALEMGGHPLELVLRRWAPLWLSQLPRLLGDGEGGPQDRPQPASTSARMLREFCAAVEALTAERTLVLWLEDLHWADLATLDLLAALAARSQAARLLVLATYRPVDAAITDHPIAPLKRRMLVQPACEELALELLDEEAVGTYVREHLSREAEPALVTLFHEHTDGNPLFMVTLARYIAAQGWQERTRAGPRVTVPLETLRERVPDGLRETLEGLLAGMSREEVAVLEAGSVAGEGFAAQAAAAALGIEVDLCEKLSGRLAGSGGILDAAGPGRWPDGTAGERYGFVHAVVRDSLYRRVPAGRRQRMHHRVAERLEAAWASQPDNAPAAELALHFERGGDPDRAVPYLMLAARGVRRRFAQREEINYIERALGLLAELPDSEERARRELELRIARARALLIAVAYTGAEQRKNVARALELARSLDDVPALVLMLSWQARFHFVAGELDAQRAVLRKQQAIAPRLEDPVLRSHMHLQIANSSAFGDALERAEREYAAVLEELDGVALGEPSARLGHDPAMLALAMGGCVAWLRGRPDEARRRTSAARERANASGDAFGLAQALGLGNLVEMWRRDLEAADALEASLEAHLDEYGFGFPYAPVHAAAAWKLGQQGDIPAGLARLRAALTQTREAGALFASSLLLGTLAGLELQRGARKEGLAALEEALAYVDASGERFWEAELHRLRGELRRLEEGAEEAAEASFQQALDVARAQGARSLELRAATSMARLWKDTGRAPEARSLLSDVYGTFTEGFDTADLRDAKALLDSLGRTQGISRK